MKLSEQWLRSWVNIPVDSQQLVNQFTMAGLEVDSLSAVGGEFSGVVVGEVLSVSKHPNSNRLHCCQVNIGSKEPLSIVCGAKNVRQGLKVAVATVGALLPQNKKIIQAELRGVISSGMICSAAELNLAQAPEKSPLSNTDNQDPHTEAQLSGILELPHDAPIGHSLQDYLNLQDHVIDIELTPNRADCLSIRGLAREAAVLNQVIFNDKAISNIPAKLPDILEIEILEPERCPRYVGRIIRNINNQVTTPIWMQEYLRRSQIRNVNAVVDITNFVMLELGQPMHAFDLAKLQGGICVRLAKADESLVLLGNQTVKLDKDTLVIADQRSPQAIAGIMGGEPTSVSRETQHLFLESAYFNPVEINLTARRYGLQTDSSYRFARGIDYELQVKAIERVTELLLEIVGGEPGPLSEQKIEAHLPQQTPISLALATVKKLLGIYIEPTQIEKILTSLGMKLVPTSEGWQVSVPSYRMDIMLEADLIEEVARIFGYEHIPATPLQAGLTMPKLSETQLSTARLAQLLIDRGYHEIISYSFIDPIYHQLLDPVHQAIEVANPISKDLSVMRTSLWPGLAKAANYNFNRQCNRIQLFEIGNCFLPRDDRWHEVSRLGGLVGGQAYPEQWGLVNRDVDFYDVKGDVESLLSLSGRLHHYTWQMSDHPALHPGQQAMLLDQGKSIGYLGAIHPTVLQKLDLPKPIFVFEFNLDGLKTAHLPQFKPISKFPMVRRDLAITVSRDLPTIEIKQLIQNLVGEKLVDIVIFDIYQGDKILAAEKSIALGLTFQEISRTLMDAEINDIMAHILQQLEIQFTAKLRI